MSDFQESSTSTAPETNRQKLDDALGTLINENLSPEEEQKALDAIAAHENSLAAEGKLPGTNATVATGSEAHQVFFNKNGVVSGSKEEALGEGKVR